MSLSPIGEIDPTTRRSTVDLSKGAARDRCRSSGGGADSAGRVETGAPGQTSMRHRQRRISHHPKVPLSMQSGAFQCEQLAAENFKTG
jgi:hypothetical protein